MRIECSFQVMVKNLRGEDPELAAGPTCDEVADCLANRGHAAAAITTRSASGSNGEPVRDKA